MNKSLIIFQNQSSRNCVKQGRQYVAPAVTVSRGQKNGRSRKERDKWKKKRRKGERQRQILSHASSVSPSLLFSCWTLTFHLNSSLTISWMASSKACSLFICLPMQKDRRHGRKKRAIFDRCPFVWQPLHCPQPAFKSGRTNIRRGLALKLEKSSFQVAARYPNLVRALMSH